MRLFVAIELPAQSREQLVALRTELPGATWVKSSALHLTLRFLGDRIEPIRLVPLQTALASIRAEPFALTLQGIGRFPESTKKPARVLWVGLVEQPALLDLQRTVEQALIAVGFAAEERAFSAHITLARLKNTGRSPELDHFLDQQKQFQAEPFTVREFLLVSSLLTPQGPIYHHEARFPLRL
ncbi:MAG: RNA 2',3'-cyclic phosphodiesterase [Chloroflexi bacterium]|nr:RNA 2',3'-cyclic phosphodiesterase [Chloroflexota bacterium]